MFKVDRVISHCVAGISEALAEIELFAAS